MTTRKKCGHSKVFAPTFEKVNKKLVFYFIHIYTIKILRRLNFYYPLIFCQKKKNLYMCHINSNKYIYIYIFFFFLKKHHCYKLSQIPKFVWLGFLGEKRRFFFSLVWKI